MAPGLGPGKDRMLIDVLAHASVLLRGQGVAVMQRWFDSKSKFSELATESSVGQARLTPGGASKGRHIHGVDDARPVNTQVPTGTEGRALWRRDVDRAALFAFVPALAILPLWAVAMVVVWLPLWLFTDVPAWYVLGGYLVAGLALFLPWVQRRLLTVLIGARRPTGAEAAKLQPAFDEVTQAWHLKGGRYVVGVVDDDDLNAYACGGHLVVVTSYAAQNLTHQELCGVLAHELCHHLGSHTVALTINQWLTMPIYLIARLGNFMNNVSVAATRAFARESKLANTVGNLIAFFFSVLSWIFASGFSAAQSLNAWGGRSAEFQADQRVVRLGYGKQLAAALRRTQPGVRASRTHPPARTRIARIEASLRKQPRSPRR